MYNVGLAMKIKGESSNIYREVEIPVNSLQLQNSIESKQFLYFSVICKISNAVKKITFSRVFASVILPILFYSFRVIA